MTDSERIKDDVEQRLRAGDSQALSEIFSTYRERLWRMIHFRLDRRLYGRIDPDDVLQEGYLAAASRLDHFAAKESLSPFIWLRMIMMQTLIDLHRRHLGAQMRSVEKEVPIRGCRYPVSTSESIAIPLVGGWTSPSQAAVRAETLDRAEQAIAQMDPMDREILALRHFEELTNAEAAEVLDLQPKAASIRYVRALRRLKEILAEFPGMI